MADGARADVFNELLLKGLLPNISKYIIEKGNYRNAVSVFPSTTGPAYTPFVLGKFPGRCNFPGIRWFDKSEFERSLFSLNRFRSYIGPESYMMNYDISKKYKTIFEIIPNTVSILNELSRGVSKNGDKTKYSKLYYKLKSHFTYKTDEVDQVSHRILIKALQDSPEFIFTVYLGIDNYSHLTHPLHNSVIDSYIRVDRNIGELVSILKQRGKLEETLLILGSDHGLTQTHSHFDLLEFMNEYGFKTLYYPNIFRSFFSATAANMVSGNSMSNLYFKCNNMWNGFDPVGYSDFIYKLLDRPEIDIILFRCTDRKICILSKRGSAYTWFDDNKRFINYELDSENDPFGYESMPKKINADEILKLTYNTDYPDSLLQINQLFESPRTGDIVLSSAHGYDLRAKHENPEHCSSHGSLLKEHMIVPLAVNTKIAREFIRTVDVFPSILELLGKDIPGNLDGQSFIG
jgi:hypothetical protein